ncbi:FHA domain-containing protein [Bifidobacterium jacchi]|uniref:FHA domain-containing protein n=1 Tax=Bifidobacterium jacchi TaxID=2490545 RepID=A0A5N5RKJ9_9BIFI|nr:FHA domain-containing protein [Bifidobacterium jacchi]KAB5607845.1 FHA domain-containing protein [Bifidobacterium jacchi]
MKIKTVKDRKAGSQTLVITTTKNETLDYACAQWLAAVSSPCLLPFKFEPEGQGGTFYYDITGCVTLKSFLKTKLDANQYNSLLVSVTDVADVCTANKYPIDRVLWDEKQIYVQPATAAPMYVLMPMAGAQIQQSGPNGIIAALADRRHIRFVMDEDAHLVDAVDDYARRNPIFSSINYRTFLGQLFGYVSTSPMSRPIDDGTHTVLRPNTMQRGAVLDPVALLAGQQSSAQIASQQTVAQRVMDGVRQTPAMGAAAASAAFGASGVPGAPGAVGAVPNAPTAMPFRPQPSGQSGVQSGVQPSAQPIGQTGAQSNGQPFGQQIGQPGGQPGGQTIAWGGQPIQGQAARPAGPAQPVLSPQPMRQMPNTPVNRPDAMPIGQMPAGAASGIARTDADDMDDADGATVIGRLIAHKQAAHAAEGASQTAVGTDAETVLDTNATVDAAGAIAASAGDAAAAPVAGESVEADHGDDPDATRLGSINTGIPAAASGAIPAKDIPVKATAGAEYGGQNVNTDADGDGETVLGQIGHIRPTVPNAAAVPEAAVADASAANVAAAAASLIVPAIDAVSEAAAAVPEADEHPSSIDAARESTVAAADAQSEAVSESLTNAAEVAREAAEPVPDRNAAAGSGSAADGGMASKSDNEPINEPNTEPHSGAMPMSAPVPHNEPVANSVSAANSEPVANSESENVSANEAVATAAPSAQPAPAASAALPSVSAAPATFHDEPRHKATITPIATPAEPTRPAAEILNEGAPQPADEQEEDDGATNLLGSVNYVVRRLRDGRAINVRKSIATIGRSSSSDIHMGGNTNVSRVHAVIHALPGNRFSLMDCASFNGTYVGDHKLDANEVAELLPGQRFRLADDDFVIQLMR